MRQEKKDNADKNAIVSTEAKVKREREETANDTSAKKIKNENGTVISVTTSDESEKVISLWYSFHNYLCIYLKA